VDVAFLSTDEFSSALPRVVLDPGAPIAYEKIGQILPR
jgi:hypothetical protein